MWEGELKRLFQFLHWSEITKGLNFILTAASPETVANRKRSACQYPFPLTRAPHLPTSASMFTCSLETLQFTSYWTESKRGMLPTEDIMSGGWGRGRTRVTFTPGTAYLTVLLVLPSQMIITFMPSYVFLRLPHCINHSTVQLSTWACIPPLSWVSWEQELRIAIQFVSMELNTMPDTQWSPQEFLVNKKWTWVTESEKKKREI